MAENCTHACYATGLASIADQTNAHGVQLLCATAAAAAAIAVAVLLGLTRATAAAAAAAVAH